VSVVSGPDDCALITSEFQTVIFDSCHSASALRGPVSKPVLDDKNSQPIARTGPALNYRIPDDLDVDIWGGKRALSVLPQLRHVGSASYVFLSACSSSELAKEDNGRGYFTSALLKLLKEVGSRTLPCSQIITCIGKIPEYVFFQMFISLNANEIASAKVLNAKDSTQLDLFFMVSRRHTGNDSTTSAFAIQGTLSMLGCSMDFRKATS
jgi:hypothetical protein